MTICKNLHIRRCECPFDKTASFGYENETPWCCEKCTASDMISIGKKCEKCGVSQVSHGFPDKSPTHCGGCKGAGMVDLKTRMCEQCGEHKASYAQPDDEKPQYCSGCDDHATMIDILSPKCLCGNKQPTLGYPGGKEICCKDCQKPGMINIYSSRCECGTTATYGFPGEKPKKCISHIQQGMIDLHRKKCISGFFGDRNASDNPVYIGYCRDCFIHLFPDEPVSKNYKRKENEVCTYLVTSFPKMQLILDKQIQGGCSRRRPDVFLDLLTHVIVVEVDENQHNGYDGACENTRVMQISEDLALLRSESVV